MNRVRPVDEIGLDLVNGSRKRVGVNGRKQRALKRWNEYDDGDWKGKDGRFVGCSLSKTGNHENKIRIIVLYPRF
ncbi:hypothetical protein Hanom_Chr02g00121061 [Helianthus anomalus]